MALYLGSKKVAINKNSTVTDVDVNGLTAVDGNVLNGVTYYGANGKSTGTMTNNSGWSQTIVSNGTYDIPDGCHKGGAVIVNVSTSGSGGTDISDGTAESTDVREGEVFYGANGRTVGSMPDTSINNGGISIDSDLTTASITATINDSGYIESGTYTIHTIDAYPITSVTPQKSNMTLETAGKYVISDITIEGDSNLISENIKQGVSIFGVAGSYGGDMEDAVINGGGIVVNDDLTTADVTVSIQNSGYIEAGTYTTHTIDAYPITSVTPTKDGFTLETGGTYVISDITIEGDSNLIAENVRSGVSIFGVEGTYAGSSKSETITYSSSSSEFSATYGATSLGSIIVIKAQIYPTPSSSNTFAVGHLIYDTSSNTYTVYGRNKVTGTVTSYSAYGTDLTIKYSNDMSSFTLSGAVNISYTSDVDGEIYSDYMTLEFEGTYDVYLI